MADSVNANHELMSAFSSTKDNSKTAPSAMQNQSASGTNINESIFHENNSAAGSVTVTLGDGAPIQIPNSATIICRGNLPKAAVEELKNWLFGN